MKRRCPSGKGLTAWPRNVDVTSARLSSPAVLAQLGKVNEGFEAYFEELRRVAADLDFDSADRLWSRVAGLDAGRAAGCGHRDSG